MRLIAANADGLIAQFSDNGLLIPTPSDQLHGLRKVPLLPSSGVQNRDDKYFRAVQIKVDARLLVKSTSTWT
jgi:hypothetical protein